MQPLNLFYSELSFKFHPTRMIFHDTLFFTCMISLVAYLNMYLHFRPVITRCLGSTSRMRVTSESRYANLPSPTRLVAVSVILADGEKCLYGMFIGFNEQIGGFSRSPFKME